MQAEVPARPGPQSAPARVPIGERGRVLAIAPTSFFGDYGCHVRILEEVRALQRRGIRTAVATYPFGRPIESLPIYRAPRFFGQRRVQPGSSPQKFSLDAVLAVRALRVAAIERPQVVHGHLHEGALIGWLVARIHRIPLVFDFQGSLTSEMIDHNFLTPGTPAHLAFRRIEQWIVGRPDAIVTSTIRGARLLEEEFGCPADRVTVVPDAVDPMRFRPLWEIAQEDGHMARAERLKAQLKIPAKRPVVVYLGLLAEYQGSSHLLQAAHTLLRRGVDAHFLIMGFPSEHTYAGIARALGIENRVTFTGAVPYERAPDYLALGSVAIAPKISETEGNGKVLNYMAMGLPTVTFDTRASREILGDLGIYAQRGDWQDLAEKIEELLADPAAAHERGRALRRKALASHTWDSSSEALVATYEQLGALPTRQQD